LNPTLPIMMKIAPIFFIKINVLNQPPLFF